MAHEADSFSTSLRGRDLLASPLFNRDLAFTVDERRALGIEALLPPAVQTLEEQVSIARAQVLAPQRPLDRFVALAELEARNLTLYYRLLLDHVEEMLPLVYTPTVGEACERYSQIFRRPRGVWITPEHRGRIADVLASSAASRDVRLIVVTDNERILGLGDLGAGGMGIPVGKLALYIVGAGLHPAQVLPISLDVGTDNARLRDDPAYVGVRARRLRGPIYDEMIDELVEGVKAKFPAALLQFEDFKKANALEILARHRDRLLCFNDDIEGTAAVSVAGVIAASRKSGIPMRDQRIVILGAGAAGIGIARLLKRELAEQGLSGDALVRALAVLDSRGLLVEGRAMDEAYKEELAWPRELARTEGLDPDARNDLITVIEALAPTALIGTSGQPKVFDEVIVRAMAARAAMPAIFPLSNPNSASEADPADLVAWTDGRALIATGSPFAPVTWSGRTIRHAQGNNVWIFPGVGLGALASSAKRLTDSMFTAAAHALAGSVLPNELDEGLLYPRIPRLREVTLEVAVAVARAAVKAEVAPPADEIELRARVARMQWTPRYPAIAL
jgi:malate dehydrogenase (oxaloacetate-decarboxylating)